MPRPKIRLTCCLCGKTIAQSGPAHPLDSEWRCHQARARVRVANSVTGTSANTTRNSVVRAGEIRSVDQDMNKNEVPQNSPQST